MNKRALIYLVIVLLTALFIGLSGCDNRLGKPDIRKEYKSEENKPDYFGWRWDFKW